MQQEAVIGKIGGITEPRRARKHFGAQCCSQFVIVIRSYELNDFRLLRAQGLSEAY